MSLNISFRLFFLLAIAFIMAVPNVQAAVQTTAPPQKKSKKRAFTKKRKLKRLFAKTSWKPNSPQEQAPSVGSVIGLFLLLWLVWWAIMAIPIVIGVSLGLPALWIIGVIIGSLPFLLVLFLFIHLLILGSQ